MKDLQKRIRNLAAAYSADGIELRRQLHRHPELSFHEYETSKFIATTLENMNIAYRRMTGPDGNGTGIVADIIGQAEKPPGISKAPVVALRADMDALPVSELNDIDFRSRNPGVMHACGHDVHTAVLLSTARILKELEEDFHGSFRLIFQPGEEKSPGGAIPLIEQGALEGVDRILGEHINPALPAGSVGFRPGLMMASADEIYLTVRGVGGHAAGPHKLVDPVLIASHIIVALQQIVSRRADPEVPSVLSFGRVIADGAMNVIPAAVEVAGTFRTVDETWRAEALHTLRELSQTLARGMGGSCEVEIINGYPVLENDPALTARSRQAAVAYLGEDRIQDLPLVMWAEDFAYYNRKVPGCFYNLGVANLERGWTSPLHSPTLMVDESAIETGSGLMAYLALSELQALVK